MQALRTWSSDPWTNGTQGWDAGCGAVFNLTSNALRPLGWTSADAAGLPIYPGLVKFDEVAAGSINHAIRITFAYTRRAYVKPATHFASPDIDDALPAMGHRFRLKSGFDCSKFATESKVVCQALKTYGAIVADNGANWYLSGEAHSSWSVTALQDIKTIPAGQMELVYTGEACLNAECTPIVPDVPFPQASAIADLASFQAAGNVYYRSSGLYAAPPVEFVDRDPVHFWRKVLSTDLTPWQTTRARISRRSSRTRS